MKFNTRRLWKALLFLTFPFLVTSQNRVLDSLIAVSKKADLTDSAKAWIYGEISWEYSDSDINLSLQYAQKELEYATKINRPNDIARSEGDIGNVYNRKSIYDTALIHYYKDLKIRQELKQYKKAAGVYVNIASIFARQNKFKEALEINFKSLKLYEQVNDTASQFLVLSNIGLIYDDLGQTLAAERFYLRSLALARQARLTENEGSILLHMGGIKFQRSVIKDSLVNKNSLDSALHYFLEAEKIMKNENDIFNLSVVYIDLGKVYILKKDYVKATEMFEIALKDKIIVENKHGIGFAYCNLGDVSILKKEYSKAADYFDKSVVVFLELQDKDYLKYSYGQLAVIKEATKEYPLALIYHKLYASYSDSIYNDETAKQLAEMQTKYETEKKDLQLAKNNAELKIKMEEAIIKNVVIGAIVFLLIFLVIAGYQFYRKKQLQQKAEMDAEVIKQKDIRNRAVIEAEEKERIRIASDLHDGVGQLLSAAKLNLSSYQSQVKMENPQQEAAFQNAITLVDDSVKEVRLVSHNMMPNTLLKFGLGSAVKEFVTKIQGMPNLKVNLEIVSLSERLEQEKETVLYRVIQEIVSNVIRHAKATELTLQVIRHEKELSVVIEDNGVGFDASKINDFEGIGLKNIMSRVEFINGTVHFDSAINRGTTVIIDIPLN